MRRKQLITIGPNVFKCRCLATMVTLYSVHNHNNMSLDEGATTREGEDQQLGTRKRHRLVKVENGIT